MSTPTTLPFGTKTAIATLIRTIIETEEPIQVVISNVPDWASQKLINAVLLIDLCQDEYDLDNTNPDADLQHLYKALVSYANGITDPNEYDWHVDDVVFISEAQIEALAKLEDVLLVYPCDFYNALKRLYAFLQARLDGDVFVLEMIHTHNPDIAKILEILIGYYDAEVESLDVAKTLVEDLKTI